MTPTDTGPARVPAEFFRVAMFFVIFDLESVFLYAGALVLRALGWSAYVEILIFVGVLVVALVYLWRLGSLDWGTSRRKRRARVKG